MSILRGAASPTVFPKSHSAPSQPCQPPADAAGAVDARDAAAEPPAPTTTDAFESGLALFEAIAKPTLADPLAVEVDHMRRALSEKENEIQEKNLLLVRTKEALIQLNERLDASVSASSKLDAEKKAADAELAAARKLNQEQTDRIDSLTRSLQDALDDGARALRDAHIQFENETRNLSEENAALTQQLSTTEQTVASLRAKICVIEASATERECALRRKLAEETERAAVAQERADSATTECERVVAVTQAQLEKERTSREKLEKRVAVTEDTVLEKMKQKEAEVQALQLKVDSHQKHLRRMSRSPAIALSGSSTPSLRPSQRSAGSLAKSSERRGRIARNGCARSVAKRQVARRQLVVDDEAHAAHVDKENLTPSRVQLGRNQNAVGRLSLKKPAAKTRARKKRSKKKVAKKVGLTVRSECANLPVHTSPRALKRNKRKGRRIASRYLTSSMR